MNIEKAIQKYSETVASEFFAMFEKEFAQRIICALSKGYSQSLYEPSLVEIIEKEINSNNGIIRRSKEPYFEIETRAIFIHGNKSQVTFDYYGKRLQRELGDLIFIISLIFNGRKYFEKITINQFKKAKMQKRSISWDMKNKEQLYLLSRFPPFEGVKGSLIPNREFNLPNYSDCLGSYGMLYEPGDFAFVSAVRLESYLQNDNKVNGNDLFVLCEDKGVNYPFVLPYRWEDWWHIYEYFLHSHKHLCSTDSCICYNMLPFVPLFGNCLFARNVFDFADKYLHFFIGEPTCAAIGKSNNHAKDFLYKLLSRLKVKAQQDKKEDAKKISNFVKSFFTYQYLNDEIENGIRTGTKSDFDGVDRISKEIESDYDGGGLTIVYTTINLGE